MKISEYPLIKSFPTPETDAILTETSAGTKRMSAGELTFSLVEAVSSTLEAKRTVYRGASLGGAFTSEQKAAIASGKFTGIFLGDYWTINNIVWRIVDFNYLLHGMFQPKNHVTVMPDYPIDSGKMNNTDINNTGYKNSLMKTSGLTESLNKIKLAFGAGYIVKYTGQYSNTWDATTRTGDSSYIDDNETDLPSQIQLFGTRLFGAGDFKILKGNAQFAAFRLRPELLYEGLRGSSTAAYSYWTQDVCLADSFVDVGQLGQVSTSKATVAYNGVRPVFHVCGA